MYVYASVLMDEAALEVQKRALDALGTKKKNNLLDEHSAPLTC